mmetsp:Transcript_27558/g.40702  ORF Transcript_27558/g.40702 Transcript_27558/m.40702 type:complete len:88 (+) Transcript_27558:3-266(+)
MVPAYAPVKKAIKKAPSADSADGSHSTVVVTVESSSMDELMADFAKLESDVTLLGRKLKTVVTGSTTNVANGTKSNADTDDSTDRWC